MIVGTAGHIDHGKTSLVRALTGVDTDRLPEEKRRGITIELGFAPLVFPDLGTVGLVDVPGHEAFIRTMLAGATGIDLALLVVAADEGVMPQTREHLAILSLLGVHAGVVALTKQDAADAEWMALVRDDVRDLLAGTPLFNAPIIETSVVTGTGIDLLRDTLRAQLAALPRRAPGDLFRMPVDRAFTVRGTGTVVTGTVWSGTVSVHTPLRLFPIDQSVRARGVQTHGASAERLLPGTRAAVALAGVELGDVQRGATLVEEGGWTPSRVLRADVALLDDAPRELRAREWVRLHLGTSDVGARVVAPGGPLLRGETRGARIVLDTPLVARALDRFVLRLASPPTTIGGGRVTDPSPPHRRSRPWPAGLEAPHRLSRLLDEALDAGLAATTLPVRLGLAPADCETLIDSTPGVVRHAGRLFALSFLDAVAERLVAWVARYHETHPLDDCAPRAALRASVAATEEASALALERAVGAARLQLVEGGVRQPGWTPVMSDAVSRDRAWLLTRLEAAGGEPPSVSELKSERPGSEPVPLLRILEKERLVVQVEADRFYAAGTLRELVERLRRGMERGRVYGPGELRELIGTSRKFLIPFLEYCDRQRITERQQEGRVLGQ